MRLTRSRWIGVLTVALVGYPAVAASAANGADFRVGAADKDISLAGEIRTGTTIERTELDLGCHGSRISQLEEHRLL